MITTEQVFDMLPAVTEIFEKLEIKEYFIKTGKENKDKKVKKDELVLKNEFAINLGIHILKNSQCVKEEVFEIAAIVDGISVEETKKQSPMKTVKAFKAVFQDKEVVELFKQAVE